MHQIRRDNDAPPTTHLGPRRRRLRQAVLTTAGLLVVGVALAACGGGSTPGVDTGAATTTTISTTTVARSSAGEEKGTPSLLAYASCMRSHGIPNFPDPSGKGGIPKPALVTAMKEVSSSRAQAASNDCQDLLPAGGLSGQPVRTIPVQDQQDYLRAVACLRSHGIPNFPDPVFSGGGVHFTIPSSINTNSTLFQQARLICERFIPAGLPDSGSGR
jgi:hypothetical protein